jgi:hypothetical protein
MFILYPICKISHGYPTNDNSISRLNEFLMVFGNTLHSCMHFHYEFSSRFQSRNHHTAKNSRDSRATTQFIKPYRLYPNSLKKMSRITLTFPFPPSSPATPQTWFETIPPTITQLQISAPHDPPQDSTFDYTAALHALLSALPSRFPSLKHINLDILQNLLAYFRSGDEADAIIEAFYEKGVVLGCRAYDQWLEEQMAAYVPEEGPDVPHPDYDVCDDEDGDDEYPEVRAVHAEYDGKVRALGLRKGLTMKEHDEEFRRLWRERMEVCRRTEEEVGKRRKMEGEE